MRAAVVDARTQPVRNLIHTPRYLGTLWPLAANLASNTADGEWFVATPHEPSSDGFLRIRPAWYSLAPGAAYTMLARIRIYGGQASNQSNGLWFYIGGAAHAMAHPPGRNIPGEYDLRITFTAPMDLSGLTDLRLYSGRVAPTAWTNIMMVEGHYEGGFADGDTPGWTWTGERGNSVSIGPGVIT